MSKQGTALSWAEICYLCVNIALFSVCRELNRFHVELRPGRHCERPEAGGRGEMGHGVPHREAIS